VQPKIIRDAYRCSTVPVDDPTGIGAAVTALCARLLREQSRMVDNMVVLSAEGLATTVQRRKRHPAGTKKPYLDHVANPISALLGGLPCTVVLRPEPEMPGWHRARCDGHNCHRHGLPSVCEMTVYNGLLTLADVSPDWHVDVHMGSRDADCPAGPCLGMLIAPTRRDRFGATPTDRANGADIGIAGPVAPGGEAALEVEEGPVAMEASTCPLNESQDPAAERYTYARLHAAAKSLIAMTDGDAADSKYVYEWFERGVEGLRRRREPAASGRPGGSEQQSEVDTGDCTDCTKLGGRRV